MKRWAQRLFCVCTAVEVVLGPCVKHCFPFPSLPSPRLCMRGCSKCLGFLEYSVSVCQNTHAFHRI